MLCHIAQGRIWLLPSPLPGNAPCPQRLYPPHWYLQLLVEPQELGTPSLGTGPVSPDPVPLPAAILEVHEDFFMYKSGIYRHTPVAEGKGPQHQRHGTHSVKITG